MGQETTLYDYLLNLKSKDRIKVDLKSRTIKVRSKIIYSETYLDSRFKDIVSKDFKVSFNSLKEDFLKFYYCGCYNKSKSQYFQQQLISEADILTLPSDEDSETLRLKLELNMLFGITTSQIKYPNNYYFYKILIHRPPFIIKREWFL